MGLIRSLAEKAVAPFGYRLIRQGRAEGPLPRTRDEESFVQIVKPYSMTSVARILALYDALRYITARGLEGDLVECGVWRGGNLRGMVQFLMEKGDSRRHVWAFDTFEGMPNPGDLDTDSQGVNATVHLASDKERKGCVWAVASLDEVKANVLSLGYPGDLIHFVKGKVEDTIPQIAPEKIALLRLDTDWYESTRHELNHLFSKLVSGGILIIDDYGAWQGARKATDEFFAGANVLMHRIDDTGVLIIKD